jgi:hypothetical protein
MNLGNIVEKADNWLDLRSNFLNQIDAKTAVEIGVHKGKFTKIILLKSKKI